MEVHNGSVFIRRESPHHCQVDLGADTQFDQVRLFGAWARRLETFFSGVL